MISGKKGEIERRYVHWLPGGCIQGKMKKIPLQSRSECEVLWGYPLSALDAPFVPGYL